MISDKYSSPNRLCIDYYDSNRDKDFFISFLMRFYDGNSENLHIYVVKSSMTIEESYFVYRKETVTKRNNYIITLPQYNSDDDDDWDRNNQ